MTLRSLAGRLLPYLAPLRRDVALAGLAALVVTAAGVARPLVVRHVIDSAVPAGEPGRLVADAVLFALLVALGALLGYAQLLLMSRVGLRVVNGLKADVFAHLMRLDVRFHDAHPVGWLISRVESDGEQVKQLCSHLTVRLVTSMVSFIAVATTLLVMDPDVGVPVLVTVGLLVAVVWRFLGVLHGVFDDVRARYADLTGFIAEYVGGIPIVQLYNRQDDIRRELARKEEPRYASQLRMSWTTYGFWGLFAFATETLLVGLVIWVGMGKVAAGTMTLGALVMFVEYVSQLTRPLASLNENLTQLQRSVVSAERLVELLDQQPTVVAEADPDELVDPAVVEFRDVGFRYGEGPWALRGVSFTVRRGETVALVGPSGGGKSTLVNLLCRFYDPTEGTILVDGRDLRSVDLRAWRRTIGLVLQDVYLFPGTVLDNLRVLDETVPAHRVHDAAARLGADALVRRLPRGWDTELAERGSNLSAGERQLLSFTRALVHEPRILVLDEATSSIDRHTERQLQQALEKLLQGRTAVVVAHRLATIRSADRILVVEDGRIAEHGTHDSLLAEGGIYRRLYSLQSEPASGRAIA